MKQRNASKLHDKLAEIAELTGDHPMGHNDILWRSYTIPDLLAHIRKRIIWYKSKLGLGKLSDG